MDVLIYPAAFLVLLGILVTIHELGHYAIARLSGVQILRFSVGFGRPLWTKVDRFNTEWVVAMLPLGGYVRMLDDRDPEQAELLRPDSKAYMDLHPRWRIAIALGGPMANFVLAVVVYAILQFAGGYEYVPTTAAPATETPLAEAGWQGPAEIVSVDGALTPDWERVSLALTSRLGETGTIILGLRRLGTNDTETVPVAINAWHQGVGDPDVVRSLGLEPSLQAELGTVVPDTPAQISGLQAGDWVSAANGEALANWQALVEVIEANPNRSVDLQVVRQGALLNMAVRPGVREDQPQGEDPRGYLGVGPRSHYVSATLLEALPNGVAETWAKSGLILSILGKMVVGDVSVKNLSGPISIAQVAGDSARYGWRYFLGILAFLSISLGVLNLLPIPILDGGHVVFSSVEWVWGKPVPEQVQIWGVQIGLVLVGCMIIFATYNDVLRLF